MNQVVAFENAVRFGLVNTRFLGERDPLQESL
jgi:hypothetical protein